MSTEIEALSDLSGSKLRLILLSHGLKTKLPFPKADFYVDCRGIKEHGFNKADQPVFMEQIKQSSGPMLDLITQMIRGAIQLIPERRYDRPDPFKEPFTICFFCAWGMNRSPAVKEIMYQRLKNLGFQVELAGKKAA